MELKVIGKRLSGLVAFRVLLEDKVFSRFKIMLESACGEKENLDSLCAEFISELWKYSDNWTEYLLNEVLEMESLAVRSTARGEVSSSMKQAIESELSLLESAGKVELKDIEGECGENLSYLPSWNVSEICFSEKYAQRMQEMGTRGYGIYAKHHVFTYDGSRLVPVRYPDPQRISELPGYEREREKVIANTKALLRGDPASNVLLYGDAGTGKSSTIKAISNEYAGEGLRLVEVKKNQLFKIPELMDELAASPLKFIIFIDDLSFTANDDNFAALKAILEGSVGGRAKNIAVYATSNRRHLIKESMSDRIGDDMHASDTRQELMSLSARFGLTVIFVKPDQEKYLSIVKALAENYGIEMDEEELCRKAVAFADRAGGRSPRCAKQFIELVKSGVQT